MASFNMQLFTSFNKIYKFNDHIEGLRTKIEQFLKKNQNYDKAKIINELDLYDSYNLDLKEVIIIILPKTSYYNWRFISKPHKKRREN